MAEKTLTTQIILRNGTTTEWEASTKVLKLGEIGIDTTKNEIRIGDGTHTWKNLKIAGADQEAIQALIDKAEDKVYVRLVENNETDTEMLATIANPAQGDMAIVERAVATNANSHTAYVYDGENWCAMDGNYSAENVYFDSDLTYTAPIGVMTVPSSGAGTISAAGKNVKEVLATILAKEANPTTTEPAASVTVTIPGGSTFEIGTKKNVTYNASLSAGSYTYGPATGVVAGTVTASFDGQTKTGATGTFENVVANGTKRLSVSITHNEGAVPKTNLGNPYADGKIAAGTKEATATQTLVGVRHMFYGPMTTDAELNSENIRKLTHSQAKTGTISTFGAGAGAVKVVVAVPTSMNVTKVLMPSAMNADATANFVKQAGSVQVEGAEGFTAAAYNVWVYKPASIDKTETYSVTIG